MSYAANILTKNAVSYIIACNITYLESVVLQAHERNILYFHYTTSKQRLR